MHVVVVDLLTDVAPGEQHAALNCGRSKIDDGRGELVALRTTALPAGRTKTIRVAMLNSRMTIRFMAVSPLCVERAVHLGPRR